MLYIYFMQDIFDCLNEYDSNYDNMVSVWLQSLLINSI